MKPLLVVIDFNETLVVERTLPRWCRDRVRSGPLAARVRAALACAGYGLLARVMDAIGFDSAAASIGLRALSGVKVKDLEEWAQACLMLNPGASAALSRLSHERGRPLALTVVSRGSPGVVIRAFLATPAVVARVAEWGRVLTIIAPELVVHGGVIAGRLSAPAISKQSRAQLLGDDAIYLGDPRDRHWVAKSGIGRARFLEVAPRD